MSASDVRDLSDDSFLDSLCDELEAALSKKACATVQKAVDDTICASLKHGIHDAVHESAVHEGSSGGPNHTPGTSSHDVCAYIEEVTGNAVCAALRQVISDTVCKTLADAISTSIQNVVRWEQGASFGATPAALNTSLEEVTGDAVCAALKQVISDTVCKALNKAIAESIAFVLSVHATQRPPPLSETVRADASIADAGQLYLGSDEVWHTPEPDANVKLCAAIEKRVTKEVCSRLQQLAASTLCSLLKKAMREEVRQHTQRCEDKNAERAAGRAVSSVLTYKTGMMVVAVIAVALIAVAAAMPGSPLHIGSTQEATTLSLYSPASSITAGGSATLTGALTTSDGSGLRGDVVQLQRQSGDTWAILGSVTTLPDGSFTFALTRGSSSAALQVASGASGGVTSRISRGGDNARAGIPVSLSKSHVDTFEFQTAGPAVTAAPSTHQTYVGETFHIQGQAGIPLSPSPPTAIIAMTPPQPYFVGTTINLDGSQSTASNGSISAYSWSVTDPPNSSAQITPSDASAATLTPDQPGDFTVHLAVTDSSGLQNSTDSSFTVSSPNTTTTSPVNTANTTSPINTSNTTGPVAPPSPTPPSNTTIVVPADPTPSPGGHLYRAFFPGSAQLAPCTSIAIRINDDSSAQGTVAASLSLSASASAVSTPTQYKEST